MTSDLTTVVAGQRRVGMAEVLACLPDLVVVTDELGHVRYANDAVRDALGYEPAALVGSSAFELLHPDERLDALASFASTSRTAGPNVPLELHFRAADGCYRLLEVVATNRLDDPAIGGIVFAARSTDYRDDTYRRFRVLFEQSPVALAVARPGEPGFVANRAFAELFATTREALLSIDPTSLVHEADRQSIVDAMHDLTSRAVEHFRAERTYLRVDGSTFRGGTAVTARTGPDGAVDELLVTIEDVTARAQAQELLERSEERFRVVFEHAPLVVSLMDMSGYILDINPAGCEMLGRSRDELVGSDAQQTVHPDDREIAIEATLRQLSGDDARAEFRVVRADGHVWWVLSSAVMIGARSPDDPPYILSLQADITARKLLENQLHDRATRDSLTGLLNRAAVTEMIDRLVHRREETRIGVMFVDLDYFKAINDSLGHAAGDEVLAAVATRLRETVRSSDTVGRLGGDEFVVVCEQPGSPEHALALARRIRSRIAEPVTIGDTTVSVDASIGVAIAGAHDNVSALLVRADAAAYRAKRAGRGRVELAID